LFTRSREYRKLLADIYVAGKIKQIAKKDDIDLLVEFQEFAKFMKVKNIDIDELDVTVEKELQEKIAGDYKEFK
jgi:hypothetical protein